MNPKKNLVMCAICIVLAVSRAAGGTDDFPSFRTFGPYCVVTGEETPERPIVMGPTGAVAWRHGREFVIWDVDKGSPADGLLRKGDVIFGANGRGLGEDPRMGLGYAITESEAKDGELALDIYRDGRELRVTVRIRKLGRYSKTWPFDCEKSRKVLDIFCDYLAAIQKIDGGFTFRTASSANGLILLANDNPKYLENARRLAYSYVRDKVSMGGQGTWPTGYTGIYLAEYYLVTGDRNVLPELQRVCKIIAEGQQPCGSWGHGAKINRYYAVGGLVNQCGLSAWLTMVLGQDIGLEIDQEAMARSIEFFGRFADRGNVPYGDHRPWDGGSGNGKDALAAVAFDILGDREKSETFASYITEYYSHREEGHTGPYFGFLWGPLGALRASRREGFHRLMNYWTWYYDLARTWEGAGLLVSNGGDTYIKRGFRFCTGAIAMPYALGPGCKRLRIMGAPKSVFAAGQLSPTIERARQLYFDQKWDEMTELLNAERPTGGDARHARQLISAAKAARKSVELTIAAAEANLKRKWNPRLALRKLHDLKTFLSRDDPRIDELLREAGDAEKFQAIYEAEKTYKKYVHLSCVDETARKAMEKIANDPATGYVRELAKKDLLETPQFYRYAFSLEEDFYRFKDKWLEDPLAFKGFKRIATLRGGEWPQWVAEGMMREEGYLRYVQETLENWVEILPISDKKSDRGRSKSCRVLFADKEQSDRIPEDWYMPEFDDSRWQEGQFPVGTFHGDRSRTIFPKGKSHCYIRARFLLKKNDFGKLRLIHRMRHIANVYLNGYMIARFVYDGNKGGYESDVLDLHPEAPKLLKEGENVIAIEGTYRLWWGIFDLGLFGKKEGAQALAEIETPPPPHPVRRVVRAAADERFRPTDIWKERQEQMDKLSVPELIAKLDSRSVHIRGHAARSLAKKGKDAAPHLIKALKRPDWHVRRGACDAIRFMGKDAAANASDALPALVEALDDKDFFVRDGAASAIAAIGKVPSDAVPKLVKLLGDEEHWWPRESAAKALAKDTDEVLPQLINAYHRNTNVRTELTLRNTIRGLVTVQNMRMALSQITELIRKDSDWLRQKVMFELIKSLKTKAKGAAPLVEEMIGKAERDKEKKNYLETVLKAISGGA